MNKFEKLIEYIINDEDDKARALFHDIVVEKSRDIYESIMDEDQMGEGSHVSGRQTGDLTNEIGMEETMEDEEEFSLSGKEGEDDDELSGELGGSGFDGSAEIGEPGAPTDGEEAAEHEDIEGKVMTIDAKLDDLLAKFDEIMGDDGMGEEPGLGDEEPSFDDGEPAGEIAGMGADVAHDEENPVMEGDLPPWLKKGSGKDGSGKGSEKSGKEGSAKGSEKSGKEGSAKTGSAKTGSAKTESRKTPTELMREYTEKISDLSLDPSSYKEGEVVGANTGAKDKPNVNDTAISLNKGPNFGASSTNIVNKRGATNEVPDGTKAFSKPSNEYSKGEGKLIGKVGNSIGGKKDLKSAGHAYKDQPQGQENKSAGTGKNSTVSVNTKPIEGSAGQPTGKKQ